MDFGLSSRQRSIVRRARASRLRGSGAWLIRPPLWLIALIALLPFLLLWHPGRYVSLLFVPLLGFWQRRRITRRIAGWALALRHR